MARAKGAAFGGDGASPGVAGRPENGPRRAEKPHGRRMAAFGREFGGLAPLSESKIVEKYWRIWRFWAQILSRLYKCDNFKAKNGEK